MQPSQHRPPLDRHATIELTPIDRSVLIDLYHTALATVERCEKLLGLPPSRPTRAERRSELRER
jgi:hypothetical protein